MDSRNEIHVCSFRTGNVSSYPFNIQHRKGVDNSLMRHKILTFTGTEEKVQK